MSLLTPAINRTVSVDWLPITTFPPTVTSPATSKLPETLTLLLRLIKLLAAVTLKSCVNVWTVLPLILKSPVSNLVASINVTLPAPSSNVRLVPILTAEFVKLTSPVA